MSHSDPSAGGFRDWERRDEPIGWAPPDSGDDIRVRARHTGAAPDAYPRNESPYRYGDGRPVGYGGRPGYDYVHREEFARYPGEGDYPYRSGGEDPDLHDPDAYPSVDADAGVDAA
jgi:hypothetical protein